MGFNPHSQNDAKWEKIWVKTCPCYAVLWDLEGFIHITGSGQALTYFNSSHLVHKSKLCSLKYIYQINLPWARKVEEWKYVEQLDMRNTMQFNTKYLKICAAIHQSWSLGYPCVIQLTYTRESVALCISIQILLHKNSIVAIRYRLQKAIWLFQRCKSKSRGNLISLTEQTKYLFVKDMVIPFTDLGLFLARTFAMQTCLTSKWRLT